MSKSTVYGVPRVFDLFTLMAMTLAFALLFALLQFLAPAFDVSPTTVTLAISSFVTLIAMAQMFMFKGENPRMASVLSGPVAMFAIFIVFWMPTGVTPLAIVLPAALAASLMIGCFFGYLAGAIVAGVLLVADALRGRSDSPSNRLSTMAKEVSFDEIE